MNTNDLTKLYNTVKEAVKYDVWYLSYRTGGYNFKADFIDKYCYTVICKFENQIKYRGDTYFIPDNFSILIQRMKEHNIAAIIIDPMEDEDMISELDKNIKILIQRGLNKRVY